MFDIRPTLDRAITADARSWLASAREEAGDPKQLPVLFAQLARRIGKEALEGGSVAEEGLHVDLNAWRTCDAAGYDLISTADASAEAHIDLYRHGDSEEKTIALRALALRPINDATVALLIEIQRTNATIHFEAGGLDSNVVVRAVQDGSPTAGFTQDDFYRFILKMAFSDLPLTRLFGGPSCATPDLSRMLQDFATEREAAGRAVWIDTYRFIGRAPTQGTLARLIGGLEHGSDPVRLAAAEGLRDMAPDGVERFVQERIGREPREDIRGVLSAIAG